MTGYTPLRGNVKDGTVPTAGMLASTMPGEPSLRPSMVSRARKSLVIKMH